VTAYDTEISIDDLRSRIVSKPQITTDAFKPYYSAIMQGFGNRCDYATLTKVFASSIEPRGRYSPPVMLEAIIEPAIGNPNPDKICTSFVERQNLSVRMECKRFARLTLAFSKKLANLKASVALHYAHYNFVRVHRTLRMTPAMAAGLSSHIWEMGELLAETAL